MASKWFDRGNPLHNTTISKFLVSLLTSICAAIVLTACGGGSGLNDGTQAGLQAAQKSALNGAARSAKSIDTFGNFNPAIWNQHNWYECNCGRNPDSTPPTSTPWRS